MARSSRRRDAPVSPAKFNTESASTQVRRSTRTQVHNPDQPTYSAAENPPEPLDFVREEGDTITVNGKHATSTVSAEDEVHEEEEEFDDESEAYSEWADADLADLDKDLIIDNLNAISVDVDDIFRLITSYPALRLFREVQNPFSDRAKRLRHLSRRLINNLEPCGKELLLHSSTLSQFVSSNGTASGEVEKMFIKANLALTITRLLQGRWREDDEAFDDFLMYIAEIRTFPSPFLQQKTTDKSMRVKFSKEFKTLTIQVGLSLLTQWLIRNANKEANQDNVDPDSLVVAVFYEDDHEQFRDISLDSSSQTMKDAIGDTINGRIAEIQKFFTRSKTDSIRVGELAKQFPVQQLIEDFIVWAIRRKEQLDQSIEKQGGIGSIRDSLWNEQATSSSKQGKRRRKSKKSREDKAMGEAAEFMRNIDEFLDENHAQVEEETQHIESPTAPRNPNEISETPQPDEPVVEPLEAPTTAYNATDTNNVDIMNDDGQSNHDAPPSAQPLRDITQDMLDGADNVRAAANKENLPHQRPRLTDRQPNATREQWDSPEPPSFNTGKRAHRLRESDDEEDEFETDARRQKRPRIEQNRVIRRASIILEPEFVTEKGDIRGSQPQSRTSAPPVHRVRPSSSQPVPIRSPSGERFGSPPPASYEGYQQIKEKAKTNMQMTVAMNPTSTNTSINLQAAYPSHQTALGRVQVRRAWTPGEIERLFSLISEYGTQWSKMLKIDAELDPPMLQNRTQVQLKDKARNMKLDYLRAEQVLPPGFEGVTISKAHKDAFRRLGIPAPEDLPGDD